MIFKQLYSLYADPRNYGRALVYMLQTGEYQPLPYLKWYWRVTDFRTVAKRQSLKKTFATQMLLLGVWLGMLAQTIASLSLIFSGLYFGHGWQLLIGAGLFISYPLIWAHLIVIPLFLGRWLLVKPKQSRWQKQAAAIFKKTPAFKIAVAGSYGKTTMKELLGTILAEGKKVAVTPANRNVAFSHAQFARQLLGDEEVLIVEYGEGAPGDIANFNKIFQPNIGIITGLAPAHLDKYKTLDRAAGDIMELAKYVGNANTYLNAESEALLSYIRADQRPYSRSSVLGWKIAKIDANLEGLDFEMRKNSQKLKLHSELLGEHNVGPLALAAALAHQLGLSKKQIEAAVKKTRAFEHRMQPRAFSGAVIIDDTYNGNLEGLKAGLQLLGKLSAKRKIYVTPGLVDQGAESPTIHLEVGKIIAAAKPDLVVLMRNSVCQYISNGLTEAGFGGKVDIEDDPLKFYTNLEQFVAAGDIVLMQNDWTDNYL